jgi:hypothetical protein
MKVESTSSGSDAAAIAAALKGKRNGKGWKCCCPAHQESNPSFTVTDGDNGSPVFYCHAGCSQEAIMEALCDRGLWHAGTGRSSEDIVRGMGARARANGGINLNDAGPQYTKPQPEPKDDGGPWGPWQEVSPPYAYTDADGKLLYQVVRKERFNAAGDKQKKFPQRRPDGNGGWEWKQGEQRVLYRWPDLLKFPDATVFVCEGEKDAGRLASLDYCATTVANGNWKDLDLSCLKGRDLIVLEDADGTGVKKAAEAAAKLQGVAKTLRVVRLPGHEHTTKDHGKDVSDWLDEDPDNAAKLEDVCFDVPLWVAPEETTPMEEEPPAGAALKLTHFNECDKASTKVWLIKDFLAKGETSGLFGPPGSGKSALETDIAVALACGEDFRGFKTKHKFGVVYFAFERADLTKRRLHAYRLRDGLDDIPMSVAGEIINLMRSDCVEIISATIKAHEDRYGIECGYIILDTAAKGIAIAGGDEDKAKDVNRCLANLRRIHELHNLHLSLVGHTGKDESRGQRGSNAAPGDYDLHIQISGEDTKTATVIKANDQPCGPLLAYRMHKVILGHNDDGDELATWIVDNSDVTTVSTPSGKTKLSKNQTTLFTILHDAKNGLTTEQWNEKAKEAGLGLNRRATLYDLRSSLQKENLIYQNPTTGLWRVKHT